MSNNVLGKSVLVLAPHPDDETFGCGGTLRMLSESGIAVDVAFMTRGEQGREEGTSETPETKQATAEARTREAHAAGEALGVRGVFFLGGFDTRLNEQPQLADAILHLLNAVRYQRVFCPWSRDAHVDHIATFRHFKGALAAYPQAIQAWLYEVWTPLAANVFVPIDRTIGAKETAMREYKSQNSQLNYYEGFRGLSSYRSLFCPSSKYAEAFLVCEREDVLNMS